jgi:hypothetical protein
MYPGEGLFETLEDGANHAPSAAGAVAGGLTVRIGGENKHASITAAV